jgi:Predicted UDP-glucose 6-dehydrogenase
MFGEGAGKAADLQFWEKTAHEILANCRKPEVVVVEKSTLPVRTAEAMAKILESGKSSTKFSVVSNPEFLGRRNCNRRFNKSGSSFDWRRTK